MFPIIKRIEPEDIPGERRSLIREVASLVAMDMPIDEAYELVGIEPREGERWPLNTFYLPTPAMVATAIQEIQASWTPAEISRRRAVKDGHWTTPEISIRELVA